LQARNERWERREREREKGGAERRRDVSEGSKASPEKFMFFEGLRVRELGDKICISSPSIKRCVPVIVVVLAREREKERKREDWFRNQASFSLSSLVCSSWV